MTLAGAGTAIRHLNSRVEPDIRGRTYHPIGREGELETSSGNHQYTTTFLGTAAIACGLSYLTLWEVQGKIKSSDHLTAALCSASAGVYGMGVRWTYKNLSDPTYSIAMKIATAAISVFFPLTYPFIGIGVCCRSWCESVRRREY